MKNIICCIILVLFGTHLIAQNGIFLPTKGTRPTAADMVAPEKFEVIISFPKGSSQYSLDAIDILDSVYNLSFSKTNPRFYKISFKGYDDGEQITEANNTLAKDRVETVYRYFTSRCKEDFMVRTATNTFMNSCLGEQQELVRYKVPANFEFMSLVGKTEKEKRYNTKLLLEGKVLIVFEDDKKTCLGGYNDCYIPRKDTIIRSPYSTTILSKGCFQKIIGSKDECNSQFEFSVEEHLDYKRILENYFLVPSQNQILIHAGYIVLRSNRKPNYGECKMPLQDSIFVRFAIKEDQLDLQLKAIGKVYSEKGVEYRTLKTKKIKSKVAFGIETAINAAQVDTIFIGKRIQDNELSNYFYPAKSSEPGAFEFKEKYYKAYKTNKYGDYVMKKPLEALFRIGEEEEEQPFEEE